MYRRGPEDLQKALDDTLMALHRERVEKSLLEEKVTELTGIIAFQERQAERKAAAFISKCADYERVKQELENAKNELAELKAKRDKDKAPMNALKDLLSAKNGSRKEKRLKQTICVMEGERIVRTIVDRGALLPLTVSRPIMLEDDCDYKVAADEKALADFDVDSSSSPCVNVLVNIDIGVSGALSGSVEYDGTSVEFKNIVQV